MTLLLLLGGAGVEAPPADPGSADFPGLGVEIAFGYTWQDTAPTWTDVTEWVRFEAGISINRGRSRELDSFVAGTMSLTLDDRTRRFDPTYTAGPYYGNLEPLVPIRFRATYNSTTYTVFRGFVEGWPQSYRLGNREAFTRITATDAFRLLSNADLVSNLFTWDSATLGVWDQNRWGGASAIAEELSGARVERILDLAGWPTDLQDVDTGVTLCNDTQPSGSPLEALQLVEQSEDGFVYVESDGTVTFLDRHARYTTTRMTTSQVTFSDADLDYPYQSLEFEYDDQLIYNDVRRTRDGGTEQAAEDSDSVGSYFRKVHSLSGLVMTTDAVALDLATMFRERYKDPLLRITALVVDAGNNAANLFPHVLGRKILDRVTVERTPQETGTAISQPVLIQGIQHELGPFRWATTYYLSPADVETAFIWDVSAWDDGDVFAA